MDLRARVDDAALVRAAQAGDGQAFGALFDRWSARVVDVAYRIVRDREVAAEVAQDAFLAAWTGLDRLQQAESFGGWVLRIGRNKALNRLERERRSVPVGDEETSDVLDRPTDPADEAGDAAARSEDATLVWAAAAALGPRDASVLDLHLRHGLTPGEIAEELGVTANTAHQVLHRLRARLGDAVRACVLWRAGRPACTSLSTAVADAGIGAFGADAVAVITAHAAACPGCTGRQEARLAPEALFAAIPVLVVGPDLLAAIRSGLADAGVPIGPPSGAPPGTVVRTGRSPAGRLGGALAKRRAVLAVAAGLVALVAVVVLLAGGGGSDDVEQVAVDGTTTSDVSSSASSSSLSSTSSSTSTTTTAPGGVSSLPAPTVPPASTTTTSPPADIGSVPEPGLGTNPPTPTTAPPPRPTTTTSTSTQPAAPPPVVGGFRVSRSPGAGTGCLDPSHRIAFVWNTTDATTVRIAGRGAPTADLPPTGNATGCLVGTTTYTLTAEGPGGTTTRSATVPA